MDKSILVKSCERQKSIFSALYNRLCTQHEVAYSSELNHRGRNLLGAMRNSADALSDGLTMHSRDERLYRTFVNSYISVRRYVRLLRHHPEYARLETIGEAVEGAFPEWVNDVECFKQGAVGYVHYSYRQLKSQL